MEPDGLEPHLVSYLKSHPFIIISISLSAAALVMGALSLVKGSYPLEQTFSLNEMEEKLPKFKIAVDVGGEVVKPGLVEIEMEEGKDIRLAEVLFKAGGLLPTADGEYVERNINLAAIAQDGMKLYIPKKGSNSMEGETLSRKINLNTASSSQLTQLPGIGETRAQAIIKGRPYSSLEELVTKAKLPNSLLESIKNEISL